MTGLFDLFSRTPNGNAEPWMTPEMQRQQAIQGLSGLAQGLLAASGPSRLPVSFGQALGAGMQQSQQAQDAYMDRVYKQMAMQKAMQKGTEAPSAVREYEYFNKLAPAEREDYLKVKRAEQMMNLGDRIDVRNPLGGVYESYVKGIPPQDQPGNVQNKEAAKTAGKNMAEAQSELPSAVDNASETLRQIGELRRHPGFSDAVGMKNLLSGAAPMALGYEPIAGSDAAGFMTRLKQLAGGQFLQAYQDLKGGGQITEVEGTKAEQAVARMQTAQSEKEFNQALDDYEGIIKKGLSRAAAKAGGPAGFDQWLAKAAVQGFQTQPAAAKGQYDLSTPSGVKYRVVP